MPRHLVVAFIFLFLGEVRSKDDFSSVGFLLPCVNVLPLIVLVF
jgi:hypothetical protein